jgi:hypothetical protein
MFEHRAQESFCFWCGFVKLSHWTNALEVRLSCFIIMRDGTKNIDVTEKLVLVPFGLYSSPDLVSSQNSPVRLYECLDSSE